VSPTSRRLGDRARLSAVTVLTLCAGLALSGCAGSGVGAAAVVGGERISVGDVLTATTQLKAAGIKYSAAQVLSLLVLAPEVIPAAGRHGSAATDNDACTAVAQVSKQNTGKVLDCAGQPLSAATLLAVRTYLAIAGVATRGTQQSVTAWWDAVLKEISKSGVRVNPRFGAFTPTKVDGSTDSWVFVVHPTTPNWVIPPSPSALATPTPSQ